MRFGFLVLAFSTMLSQWSQDLVENRRNLRTIMIGIGAIQITLVSSVELWFGGSSSIPMWFEIFNSLMLMLIFFSIGSWFLVIQPNGVFNTLGVQGQEIKAAQLTQAQDPLTSTERAWVVALKKIMTIEQVYHQSELSIGGLANQLFIPEHQLRRLINKHLGYRNFNDYLNKHRLDDASKRLMDPQNERLPILSIALDVGYGSIAPFNRAFKQRFGQTPSEYRSALQG
jgi:AraC-like DNA-binding protein